MYSFWRIVWIWHQCKIIRLCWNSVVQRRSDGHLFQISSILSNSCGWLQNSLLWTSAERQSLYFVAWQNLLTWVNYVKLTLIPSLCYLLWSPHNIFESPAWVCLWMVLIRVYANWKALLPHFVSFNFRIWPEPLKKAFSQSRSDLHTHSFSIFPIVLQLSSCSTIS